MKKILIALLFVTAAGFAAAQNNTYSPSTDVLGAHLNYGRGCAACHAPHSGVYGNGNAKTADPTAGTLLSGARTSPACMAKRSPRVKASTATTSKFCRQQ